MSITTQQISLVKDSFVKVQPIADTAAEIFYSKLFEYDPGLRSLFSGDMKQQGRKLMKVLGTAVASLDNLEELVPVLQSLADRHVQYGVTAADYTPVGNALLFALKQGLGEEFTTDVEDAWAEVYQLVADTMRSHSYVGFDSKSYAGATVAERFNASI